MKGDQLICFSERCQKPFIQQLSTQHFCSKACKNYEHVRRKRRRYKQKAVDYKGGQCERCGYDKCLGALVFHHTDPSTKEFTLACFNKSWETTKKELDKCELLCANCHSEHHDSTVNMRSLPLYKPKKPKPKGPKIFKLFLSKEELEVLVWQKPLTQLAKDLGCSDNAIRKRCKKFGVSLPRQGYWLRK